MWSSGSSSDESQHASAMSAKAERHNTPEAHREAAADHREAAKAATARAMRNGTNAVASSEHQVATAHEVIAQQHDSMAKRAESVRTTQNPTKDSDIKAGDVVTFKKEFQDKGDEKYSFRAMHDADGGRVRVTADGTYLTFPPNSDVRLHMIAKVEHFSDKK